MLDVYHTHDNSGFQLSIPLYIEYTSETPNIEVKGVNVTTDEIKTVDLNSISLHLNGKVAKIFPLRDFITNITIPSHIYQENDQYGNYYNITYIAKYALAYCRNLETLYIPKTVTCIYSCAFMYCDGLQTIYYEGTEAEFGDIEINTESDLNVTDTHSGKYILDNMLANSTSDDETKAKIICSDTIVNGVPFGETIGPKNPVNRYKANSYRSLLKFIY